jgi:hypothetical protein
MKKFLIIVLLASFVQISCNKEGIKPATNNPSSPNPNEIHAKTPWGIVDRLFVHFPNFGDVWCGAQPIDCFQEVVIYGSPAHEGYDELQLTLFNSFLQHLNQGNIANFFNSEDWSYLFSGLPLNVVEQIIMNNYGVIYTESSNDQFDHMLIIVDSLITFEEIKDENIVLGVPIRLE